MAFSSFLSLRGDNAAACLPDVPHGGFRGKISVPQGLQRFAVCRSNFGHLGVDLFPSVFWARVLFSRVRSPQLKTDARPLFNICDDGPYTMIHFQKPMPEAFAAIFAGVFLGWLSFKNGNIWMGLVLHCTVAFSMDILALYNKGLLS
jgi:hypothetical protein